MDTNDTDAPPGDLLLTPNRLAARWGLPVKRIRHAVRDGELRAFQLGAWTRIRLRDAEQWLARHRVLARLDAD